jgi:hypothetical protein
MYSYGERLGQGLLHTSVEPLTLTKVAHSSLYNMNADLYHSAKERDDEKDHNLDRDAKSAMACFSRTDELRNLDICRSKYIAIAVTSLRERRWRFVEKLEGIQPFCNLPRQKHGTQSGPPIPNNETQGKPKKQKKENKGQR